MFRYFYWKNVKILIKFLFYFCSVILFQLQRSIYLIHLKMWCIQWGGFGLSLSFALIWGLPACGGLMCFLKHNFSINCDSLDCYSYECPLSLSVCLRLQTYCDLRYHSKYRGCFLMGFALSRLQVLFLNGGCIALKL